MHNTDIVALLTRVVGICALVTAAIGGLGNDPKFGPYVTLTLGILGAVSTVATDVIRILNNPTPPTGTTPVLQSNKIPQAVQQKGP